MMLKEGIYDIVKGYKAIIIEKGTKVQILKRKEPVYDGYRCRDCIHCKIGKYKFSPNQWWESAYCDKKPKIVAGESKYFYSTQDVSHACEMFELKGKD